MDYGKVIDYKRALLEKAFVNFKTKLKTDDGLREDYVGFLDFASAWLEDWALFAALKDEHKGESWHKWEAGLARRDASAIESARAKFAGQIEAHKFFQYAFFRQWLKLKRYANERGVRVIGDMPIFVAHNSSDVWARPRLFKLEYGRLAARSRRSPARRLQRDRAALGQPALRLGQDARGRIQLVGRSRARRL